MVDVQILGSYQLPGNVMRYWLRVNYRTCGVRWNPADGSLHVVVPKPGDSGQPLTAEEEAVVREAMNRLRGPL
jgi:hypothetical protein